MKELLIYALEVLVCSAALLLAYSVCSNAGRRSSTAGSI
jgi:hypothetical protein